MYILAQTILLLGFFISLALAAVVFSKPVAERLTKAASINRQLESFCLIASAGMIACLLILLAALLKSDYSLAYCLGRSSPDIPAHFRASALWSGPEGSLLFWAASASIAALLFQHTKFYDTLPSSTALYFWGFFYLIFAFFLFLLSTFSQPFAEAHSLPLTEAAYNGLNPILRHPANIIHPPLIFMGYALLTVPACLGLARLASGPGSATEDQGINTFLVSACVLLGAGIVLGMWWAYTEASWGGYWTWDPVENSSLLPWLALAAALYANYFEKKRKKIFALSSLLYILPLPAAFLATYIVRSGILASKHSFSLGNWSLSLIAFAALLLLLAGTAFRFSCKRGRLASPFSREGLVLFQIFLLFAMGLVITAGTLWPWLTATFGKHALALDASFYINACLPILLLFMANMILISCLSWDGRSFSTKTLIILLTAAAAAIGTLYLNGFTRPLPLILAGLCTAIFLSAFASKPPSRLLRCGFAILIFGVSMSSAYKEEWQLVISPAENARFGQWEMARNRLEFGQAGHSFAKLEVTLNGESVILEQRAYGDNQVFSKTGFVRGIANELSLSVLQLNKDGSALVRVVNSPFVNFIWLGGILMCAAIFPAWMPKRSERC